MLTSILLNKSIKSFFKGSIKDEVFPVKLINESFLLSSLSALIKSLIDSACIKSSLLCIKALEVYSPLVAILAPYFIDNSIILLKISGEP